MTETKNIAIDTATIFAGHGGSGGGIWTYTKNLLLHLDKLVTAAHPQFNFVCFANSAFNLNLKNIKVVYTNIDTRSISKRLLYIHFILPKLCKKNKIHILHKLTNEVPFSCPSLLVITIHDFMLEFYKENGLEEKSSLMEKIKSRYYSFITERGLNVCKAIVTPSQTTKNEIVKRHGLHPNKIFVTELATSVESNIPVSQSKVQRFNFFCIAAYHKHKGHFNTVDIFENLLSHHQLDAHLYFRGNIHDAAFYQKFLDRVEQSPYKDRIHVVDFDKQSSLSDIYSQADFLFLLSEYEGFGLPVIEAQKFGIPVICSDIETFKEVAGDSAFYVHPNQKVSAAKSIFTFATSRHDVDELIAKGKMNTQKYSWQTTAQKTLDVYKKVNDSSAH